MPNLSEEFVTVQWRITMKICPGDPSRTQVSVEGPVNDRFLSYAAFEGAKDAVRKMAQNKEITIPLPGENPFQRQP